MRSFDDGPGWMRYKLFRELKGICWLSASWFARHPRTATNTVVRHVRYVMEAISLKYEGAQLNGERVPDSMIEQEFRGKNILRIFRAS